VHAVEVEIVRFTADVPIRGARRGMDADANVTVEFVDYDCDKRSRAYWYKEYEKQFRYRYYDHEEEYEDYDDEECGKNNKKHLKNYKKKFDPACCDPYDPCEICGPCGEQCEPEPCKPVKKPCKHPIPCEPCVVPCKKKCSRRFDVAVVLRISAKVMCDRPIYIYQGQPGLPLKPKG
jgi:hypothetical protein